MKIRSREILFLRSNKNFEDRMLKLTVCPVCGHKLARLIETRRCDGRKYDTLFTKHKADKILRECADDIERSSLDSVPVKGALYGFRYGANKEKTNKKTGDITITQEACDFWGNKETVRTYNAGDNSFKLT